MNKYFEYLLSLPKSLLFCARCLPIKRAIRVPILIRYNVVVRKCGQIELGKDCFGTIRIGFGNVGIFDKKYERTIWDCAGKVSFRGKAWIGQGCRIIIGESACWTVGENLTCTAMMSLICYNNVCMGDNVLISWESLLMDTDFHPISHDGHIDRTTINQPIVIGNHVWIGCRTIILKGTYIDDECVVAAGSVVCKTFEGGAKLIAGNPAQIKKHDISWAID